MNTKQEAGNEKVTIYDIARQAGVSTTTVHKALHGQKASVMQNVKKFYFLRKI